MPYDEEGKFYTTRIEDDLRGPDAGKRLIERTVQARQFAQVGARIGSRAGLPGAALGAALGGISGFILGDQETVFPVDMIAIPAYQAYLIQGTPAFQIFIKEGEVLTQVQLTDAMQANALLDGGDTVTDQPKKKRKPSKWNRYCAKKSNQIMFKSGNKKGLLNLKKMGVEYRKINGIKKPRKKGGKK